MSTPIVRNVPYSRRSCDPTMRVVYKMEPHQLPKGEYKHYWRHSSVEELCVFINYNCYRSVRELRLTPWAHEGDLVRSALILSSVKIGLQATTHMSVPMHRLESRAHRFFVFLGSNIVPIHTLWAAIGASAHEHPQGVRNNNSRQGQPQQIPTRTRKK
jgi:hypothetical protein